jgi:hypothetical protein
VNGLRQQTGSFLPSASRLREGFRLFGRTAVRPYKKNMILNGIMGSQIKKIVKRLFTLLLARKRQRRFPTKLTTLSYEVKNRVSKGL